MLCSNDDFSENYCIEELSSADTLTVSELYQSVSESVPYGFLASRNREDFAEALSDPSRVVAVGVRYGRQLVAYSICRYSEKNPYSRHFILDNLFENGGPIYVGMGTVVLPKHEGKLLMARMLKLRADLLKERAARNVVGLVAVENLPSMVSILRANGLFVGFHRDETSLNYVAVGGGEESGIMLGKVNEIATIDDLDSQSQLFSQGLVGHKIERLADGRRNLVFCNPLILDEQ